jgi:hypothetical protein
LATTLDNLVPPYIKSISDEYLIKHPGAEKLFESYPRRLRGHDLSFQLMNDTIRLSFKFDDTLGKSFVFVYDEGNWFLENVEYFIGELPMYWWREGEFYYPLNDKLKVIETRVPKVRITIDQFDLKEAFKYREEQRIHLGDWHIDRIDESKWKSVMEVTFEPCRGMNLPDDWMY